MKKILLLCACLFPSVLQAWDCKYEKDIDLALDLAGSEELSVLAAAGDLEITGIKNGRVASIKGRACVSEEEWLEESTVETSEGKHAEIRVELPEMDDGWSWSGRRYAYIDLVLNVPEDISLTVKDSSGDIEIEGVGAVAVQDSSGDLEIRDSAGPVSVQDSSGDIKFTDIKGDVTIVSDSSGDIRGTDIQGSVLVKSDSSGDIRFSDIGEDFLVERDSSGDITANRVGGDFEVQRDGGGDINARNVSGEVKVPRDT